MQDDQMPPNWRPRRPPTNPTSSPTWRAEQRPRRSDQLRSEPSLPSEPPRVRRSAPQDGLEGRPRRSMQQSHLEPPRARRLDQFHYPEPSRQERPQPSRRLWGWLFVLLGSVLALVLIAAASLALLRSHAPAQSTAHSRSPSPATTQAASPAATQPSPAATAYVPMPKDSLNSVYMDSADDGWAVGNRLLLLHYQGGQWDKIDDGTLLFQVGADSASLSQVVMRSASDGWAVGTLSDYSTNGSSGLILHYSGGRWMVQPKIAGITLSGLAMPSANEGWAVGSTSQVGTGQSVLLHDSGGTWTRVPSTGLSMDHIVMTSPTDGWIVGTAAPGVSAVWHYTGSAWTQTSIPGMNPISAISMVSATDVWAIGTKANPAGARAALAPYGSFGGESVFEHYDGKTWSVLATPTITQSIKVTSLALDASNDGWALGSQLNPSGGAVVSSTNLYLHYTGGQWVAVNGPAGTGDDNLTVSLVSSDDAWAVGDGGIILHYQQGAWTVAVNPA